MTLRRNGNITTLKQRYLLTNRNIILFYYPVETEVKPIPRGSAKMQYRASHKRISNKNFVEREKLI